MLQHVDHVITVLVINGEPVVATPNHPFYDVESGWIPAAELRVGARVLSSAGTGFVESVSTSQQTTVLWNLTVAEVHTFTVGTGEWVVHNQCGPKVPRNRPTPPAGMTNPDLGRLVGWGMGDAAAREAISRIDVEALRRAGLTADKAADWAQWYREVSKLNPGNPSAAGRADLMDEIARLLR